MQKININHLPRQYSVQKRIKLIRLYNQICQQSSLAKVYIVHVTYTTNNAKFFFFFFFKLAAPFPFQIGF